MVLRSTESIVILRADTSTKFSRNEDIRNATHGHVAAVLHFETEGKREVQRKWRQKRKEVESSRPFFKVRMVDRRLSWGDLSVTLRNVVAARRLGVRVRELSKVIAPRCLFCQCSLYLDRHTLLLWLKFLGGSLLVNFFFWFRK